MTSELEAAKTFLRAHFPGGARVLCAVSGGVDSMCLLDLMTCWGPEAGFSVTAAHFNHQLRGPEADRDEAFVRDHCARNRVPFLSGTGDTRRLAEQEGLSLEEAARRLRYRFLEQAADEAGCAAILTAHHADDNAETMLLNLIRGTGSAGLAGIPPVRGRIFRPFLGLSRAELEAYARARHLPSVEDATNLDPDAADRNVLRHQVLPVLRRLNPRAAEHMARTAAILRRESEVLETLSEHILKEAEPSGSGWTIPCGSLRAAPRAAAERAALDLMARAAGSRKDLSAVHAEALLALALAGRSGETRSLPYGLTARRSGERLELFRKEAPPGEAAIALPGTVSFGPWQVTLTAAPPKSGETAIALDPDICKAALRVTAWQPRDWMTLAGARGPQSLKRLFSQRGIVPPERERLPVLRAGETPAAVPGLGADAQFLPKTAEKAVFVIFHQQTEEFRHEK